MPANPQMPESDGPVRPLEDLPLDDLHVAVAAPSRQLLTPEGEVDHALIEKGLRWLETQGASATLFGVMRSVGRFSDTDEARALAWMRAATSDADLVLALRGGYGMTRLLRRFDWSALAESKIPAMGFSDFTAYQAALWTKTGRASWHGPTLSSFAHLVNTPDAPTTLNKESVEAFFVAAKTTPEAWTGFSWKTASADAWSFTQRGLLWGGNLAMVTSLVGTPWLDAERMSGGILYLEDVGESAYRIERMLLQLADAGILGHQRAVLLGNFAGADRAAKWTNDFRLADAVAFIRSILPAGTALVSDFPIGHGAERRAVPFGVEAELTVGEGRAHLASVGALLEGGLSS